MANMFRLLKADEIEARIQSVKENGAVILLYKDARVDQNILDETVGPMNWQKSYSRDNANCTVSIWDGGKMQWISKEDTGTESNTEAQKGLASDSFKRACFNWGIGRELYTAPFTWIKAEYLNITNGRCYDNFKVTRIEYDDQNRISFLEIYNMTKKCICFKWSSKTPQQRAEANENADGSQKPANAPRMTYKPSGEYLCSECGTGIEKRVNDYSVKKYGRPLCMGCQINNSR